MEVSGGRGPYAYKWFYGYEQEGFKSKIFESVNSTSHSFSESVNVQHLDNVGPSFIVYCEVISADNISVTSQKATITEK